MLASARFADKKASVSLAGMPGEELPEGKTQDFIHEIRTLANELGGGDAVPEALDQVGLMGLDAVAENLMQHGRRMPALFNPLP